MSETIRDTQRIPRSCTACSRRKIKCSKTIPCSACVRRGESSSCAREVVRVNGKFTVAIDVNSPSPDGDQSRALEDENRGLIARIQHLEALLLQNQNQETLTGDDAPNSSSSVEVCTPQDDILSTFHGLHVESTPTPSQGISGINQSGDHLLSILPIRQSSEQIVRFSLETQGWIHCALNAPRFFQQHEDFWSALSIRNFRVLDDHAWVALYLSVLCAGVYFMEGDVVSKLHFLHEGFSGHSGILSSLGTHTAHKASWIFYGATLQELNHADFLGKPALSTVQTLAVLSLVHRNLGQAEREYNLLGVAISTGKALKMDRLGQEHSMTDKMMTSTCWTTREDREIGRRLWWTLVICDWMMMPNRSCSIPPGSFNSVLSIEDDNTHRDIILGSIWNTNTTPSPLAYHLAIARIASIVQPYRHRCTKVTIPSMYETLQKLDDFTQSLPSHLVSNTRLSLQDETMPLQAQLQRSLVNQMLEACRINICLTGLPIILDIGEHDKFLWRGRNAATNLVEQQRTDSFDYYRIAWGPRAALLSAGIYLMLDLICFRGTKSLLEVEDVLEKVTFVLQVLETSPENSRDSATVLRRLFQISNSWPKSQVVDKQSLFYIMGLAATPMGGVDIDSMRTPGAQLGQPIASSQFLEQDQPVLESQIFEGDNFPTLDAHFPLDFDGIAFEFFQHVPDGSIDWSTNFPTDLLSEIS